ncbi:type I-E CRISPR-associated protein Cas7/Cse4/CasC [Bacillota bacterium Meth-B3]
MNGNERLFLDVHVIQTVPPSCVNRDDTGSPKTAFYGGVTRARASSQSWKRAMRMMFRDTFTEDRLGYRTKKIVGLVAEEIRKLGDEKPEASARKILETAGLKIKSEDKGTDALFFMSAAQAQALAELIVQNPKADKKMAQAALRESPSVDIALFGRMVADDPTLNNDASAQVAHAISTHRVANEYDYFTAVDDMSPEDNAGAGHIGMVEFNSATLYRYATIAVHELYRQLKGGAIDVACEFVRAFATSMPTGKQNTFANRTLPDAMLVTLRTDQPLNLVGAFERPVPASDEGYAAASAKRLSAHAMESYMSFAGEPEAAYVVGKLLSDLGEAVPMSSALDALAVDLSARLTGEGAAK